MLAGMGAGSLAAIWPATLFVMVATGSGGLVGAAGMMIYFLMHMLTSLPCYWVLICSVAYRVFVASAGSLMIKFRIVDL
jgi:hypothetical protein